ncbi:MAG: hypothetical protein HY901_20895 [Deltaproteobacteria bacterium]|nr:hypothetical protein [Deltaproteobacteria bacterium]
MSSASCLALLAAAALGASPQVDEGWPERARILLDQGQPRAAIELLKAVVGPGAESRERALLLARAYLAEGNDFWALRTLQSLAARDPGDCEARLALAWIALRQKVRDAARAELEQARCPAGALAARRSFLEAAVAAAEDKPSEARAALISGLSQPEVYAEDLAALPALRRVAYPGYVPPLTARVELSGLWTSNARAGSPIDPQSERATASAGGQASASLRLLLPGFFARPILEGEMRAMGYGAEESRDYGTLLLSGRPALLLDLLGGALVAYRFEALRVEAGDRYSPGPLLFSNAHRGELELALPRSMTIFGGAGRRFLREDGRTRTEADLGLGGTLRPASFVHLMGALTGRAHWSRNAAYDLWGGTLLVSAEWRLPRRVSIRTGLAGALDRYPRSAGYFGTDEARRDLLLRASLGLWSPTLAGVRAGLTYELGQRWSSAAAYSFSDHRVLLKLVWSYTWDPFTPRAAEHPGSLPLDWGLGTEAGDGAEERVQDMLRQDEALQRGSTCVER